jgi:carbonic anhydrase
MKKNLLLAIICIIVFIGILEKMYKKNSIQQNDPFTCQQDHAIINNDSSLFFATVIKNSKEYQERYQAPPKISLEGRVAIVTCMDSRIDILAITGLPIEKMLIMRNAGGRISDDVLRSLTLSHKLLGVEEIFVIQHTDCGLQKITNHQMNNLLEKSIFKSELIQNCNITLEPLQDNTICQWKNKFECCGHQSDEKIDWLPIMNGLHDSVLHDVAKIRQWPLIPSTIPIYGFIFDVNTGTLMPIQKAMEAGKAKSIICTE